MPNIERAILQKYNDVDVGFNDGRYISSKQRRAIYALISEIADFVGDDVESQKETMKMDFVIHHMQAMERKIFSLANTDMTTARLFQTYLIDFIIKHDVPTKISLLENNDDIAHYIYSCLANKKCCICGRHADLHHVQSVGSQGYRDKINHIGLDALPLCREHHIESHKVGQESFMNKYHLQPVKIDKKIAKLYRLNTKGE